jgi:hypothetical protein
VFAGMEGTRPVLVEIQALVAPSSLGTPRRAVIGWDSARLSMILAVLEAHCGVRLGQHDVYLNVAGGYRIPNRRPIWLWLRLWSPLSPGLPFPPIASISAKSACRGRSGRSRKPATAERSRKTGLCQRGLAVGISRSAVQVGRGSGPDGNVGGSGCAHCRVQGCSPGRE